MCAIFCVSGLFKDFGQWSTQKIKTMTVVTNEYFYYGFNDTLIHSVAFLLPNDHIARANITLTEDVDFYIAF